MNIDRHIYFKEEEYNNIQEYSVKNKLPFSKAVCQLCNNALNNSNYLEKLLKIEKSLEYICKKQSIILSLGEQIYSDMDFDNITDPKKSKPLNEFNKKIRKYYLND